jgi:hypothetical protein
MKHTNEKNYFADLRPPEKGSPTHDPDRFRHEVMERIIESRQLQAAPKRYKRVPDWDAIGSFLGVVVIIATLILWLFVGGSR